MAAERVPLSSSLRAEHVGRGTAQGGGGAIGALSPSTALRAVPLPIRCADRED
ncbi:MAG: hypothetical protein QOH86_808 [Sphingomonadales bacterium]|nr:hypothetical protein [Sphingomonadales bacterium]